MIICSVKTHHLIPFAPTTHPVSSLRPLSLPYSMPPAALLQLCPISPLDCGPHQSSTSTVCSPGCLVPSIVPDSPQGLRYFTNTWMQLTFWFLIHFFPLYCTPLAIFVIRMQNWRSLFIPIWPNFLNPLGFFTCSYKILKMFSVENHFLVFVWANMNQANEEFLNLLLNEKRRDSWKFQIPLETLMNQWYIIGLIFKMIIFNIY